MVALNRSKESETDENLVRHLVLNTLRFYRSKYIEKYGELIICCDSRHYWRRDYFPNYKANRKKDRASSGYDWDFIFTTLNGVRDEIKENFPYKVVEVYGAEADDIIAILVKRALNDTNNLIVSSGDNTFGTPSLLSPLIICSFKYPNGSPPFNNFLVTGLNWST